MPFTRHDGLRLYWRLDGETDKQVLVLLNSIGTDMTLWDRALPGLLRDFRLLRIDCRGHGASDESTEDATLEVLARDVLTVMDAAEIQHAAICGVSLGGMVAMTLALLAPERVTALVPACTSAQMDRDAWAARIEAIRHGGMAAIAEPTLARFFSERFRGAHPEIVGSVRTGLLAMSPNGYARCAAAIRDMALKDRLGAIRVPCLVIAGGADVSTPYAGHGDAIVAGIPGAQQAILDAAHLACLEVPDRFVAALRAFLVAGEGDGHGEGVATARDTLFAAGLRQRRAVLGDAWVDRSLAARTAFDADYQAMITRIAWNEIWGRPGLDHRTRRLLVLAITAALGRWEEFKLHVRSGLEQDGFTREELKETLMQTAIYAGVPAANTAFAEAKAILRERDEGGQT